MLSIRFAASFQSFDHFDNICVDILFLSYLKKKLLPKIVLLQEKKEIFKFESQIQEMEIMTNNPIISLRRNLEYNL